MTSFWNNLHQLRSTSTDLKANYFKSVGSNKTKWLIQDSKNRQRSTMPEEGEP